MIPSSSPIPRRLPSAGPVAGWSLILLAAALIASLILPATARAAGARLVVDTPPAAPVHVQATTHITD